MEKDLATLSDEELLKAAKDLKPTRLYDSIIIGFLAGIAIYSIYKSGFGLLTFLPLIYLPIIRKNKQKTEEVNRLLNERGLV